MAWGSFVFYLYSFNVILRQFRFIFALEWETSEWHIAHQLYSSKSLPISADRFSLRKKEICCTETS
jgi:hypothetical protein